MEATDRKIGDQTVINFLFMAGSSNWGKSGLRMALPFKDSLQWMGMSAVEHWLTISKDDIKLSRRLKVSATWVASGPVGRSIGIPHH